MKKSTFSLLFFALLILLGKRSFHAQGSILQESPVQTKQFPYENLVFEGAGIKGIAYSGVLERT